MTGKSSTASRELDDYAILRSDELTSSANALRGQGTAGNVFDLPSEDESKSDAFRSASRIAGRINAAGISDDEYNALLQERQSLLDKYADGTLNRRERNRLEYVRWSLDRIDDARHGYILDAIESAVAQYEKLGSDIQYLISQLDAFTRAAK